MPMKLNDFTVLHGVMWLQAVMDVVVNPPRPGEPSYDLFMKVQSIPKIQDNYDNKKTFLRDL